MAKRKRHDWGKIKKAYEAGLTQPEILLEFECPKSTLSEKVKNEKWVQSELAKAYTVDKVKNNEQKSELIEQDNELFVIADNKANEISRRRGLIFNLTEKVLQKVEKALDKKRPVLDSKGNDTGEEEDVEYAPKDLKEYVETIDKASLTLGVNSRHANQQINVNTQNNINNAPIEIEWD